VTRLKDNALYQARKEFDIPDDADSGVLKDELIELSYGKNKTEKHLSRRIAYWDSTNGRLFEFITNNNENAIIIQIWSVMPANLLLMILKSRIKRKWAFSNMVSVIRQHLMSYIDVRSFFENPEKAWQELLEEQKARQNGITGQYSLFPQWEEACF